MVRRNAAWLDDPQKELYKGRNVVERCFNKLKQWRGIAMRSDKTARKYHDAPPPNDLATHP